MSTNIYGNQYQPSQYSYQSQPYQPYQQSIPRYTPQPYTNIEYVNGVESVKAMPLPPNCIRLYLDSELPQFYIKRTDVEGRATVQVYTYTDQMQQQSQQFVTMEQFKALEVKFDELKEMVGEKNA